MVGSTYNFDNFQIQPHTVDDGWVAGDAQAFRQFDARMSNFNAMYRGSRRSDDYTRTVFGFAHEENPVLPDPELQEELGFGVDWAEYNYNPYVWGSTVKRILDDQAHKMGMEHQAIVAYGDTGMSYSIFHMDVSDQDEVTAAGIIAGAAFLNYPTEGWKSFGGKYDKHEAYQG